MKNENSLEKFLFFFLARPTSDKPVNTAGTGNGSTTAQKSASPSPSSQSTPSPTTTTTTRSATINNTGMMQYSHWCPSKLALILYILYV